MERTLSVILIVLALVLGLVCGVIFTPSENCEVCKTCEVCPAIPECEVCEVCEVAEPCDTCEATSNELLDLAIEDVLDYLEDEDKLICDNNEFDRDEVSVRKIYDTYSIEYDDDEYTVAGKVKLNFKEEDEKRCREVFDFTVFYDPDEDPEITILD